MNGESYLVTMWEQMACWQLPVAIVCGVLVGWIYFSSLRWSINKMQDKKYKVRFFAGVALLRILLFFGVMMLIAQRNVAVVLVYVVMFFVTKMFVLAREKSKIVNNGATGDKNDSKV